MAEPQTSTGGFNPMNWDCDKQGCWNKACRPPIHFFHDCFPRKISMSDIDGTVELDGYFLFMEWKSHTRELPTGQQIYFEKLTRLSPKIICIIVHAEPLNPYDIISIRVMRGGKLSNWEPCNLDDLVARVKRWADGIQEKVAAA